MAAVALRVAPGSWSEGAKELLENMMSPASVRPQNIPLSWMEYSIDEEDGRFAVIFRRGLPGEVRSAARCAAAAAVAAVAAAADAKLPSPSVGVLLVGTAPSEGAPKARVGSKAGVDRICGDVHMAAISNVDADELAFTASISPTGFVGICRRW